MVANDRKFCFFELNAQNKPYTVQLGWKGFNYDEGSSESEKLFELLQELPTDCKDMVIDLSGNQLGNCKIEFLTKMMESITVKVKYINLSFNRLGRLSDEDLMTFFKAIPPGVEGIIFHNNLLGSKSITFLDNLFKALPGSVTRINIARNSLNDEEARFYQPHLK
jgi:hypothetical protein